jgi:hypothetical protein
VDPAPGREGGGGAGVRGVRPGGGGGLPARDRGARLRRQGVRPLPRAPGAEAARLTPALSLGLLGSEFGCV